MEAINGTFPTPRAGVKAVRIHSKSKFCHNFDRLVGDTQALIKWIPGSFRALTRTSPQGDSHCGQSTVRHRISHLNTRNISELTFSGSRWIQVDRFGYFSTGLRILFPKRRTIAIRRRNRDRNCDAESRPPTRHHRRQSRCSAAGARRALGHVSDHVPTLWAGDTSAVRSLDDAQEPIPDPRPNFRREPERCRNSRRSLGSRDETLQQPRESSAHHRRHGRSMPLRGFRSDRVRGGRQVARSSPRGARPRLHRRPAFGSDTRRRPTSRARVKTTNARAIDCRRSPRHFLTNRRVSRDDLAS